VVESLKIVGLGMVAAIAYGIAHDNVTARVCVEYFTIGHEPIFGTDSPTLLALGWGVVATWWVGLGLGILLAFVCRIGRKPKLTAADLLKPLGVLLATMAVISLMAGFSGYRAATHRWFWLAGPLAERVPAAKHNAFLADGCAHLAAYATSFLGGLVLSIWAMFRRRRLAKTKPSTVPEMT
jgi:O-antigen/teichoic acid export membrane protein